MSSLPASPAAVPDTIVARPCYGWPVRWLSRSFDADEIADVVAEPGRNNVTWFKVELYPKHGRSWTVLSHLATFAEAAALREEIVAATARA